MNWHRPGNRTKNDEIQNTKHGHKQTTWLSHNEPGQPALPRQSVGESERERGVYIPKAPGDTSENNDRGECDDTNQQPQAVGKLRQTDLHTFLCFY